MTRYMLAHIFRKEGDIIGYCYDYGDKWQHELEVRITELNFCTQKVHLYSAKIEKILPIDNSDGVVKIIDGKGMCPGGKSR